MQAKVTALIICDEQEQQDELCRLFEFVNISILPSRSNSWQRHVQELEQPQSLSCAFIVAAEDEKKSLQLVEQVLAWQAALPVLLLGPQPESWSYDQLELVTSFLPQQLQYHDLVNGLHKAQIYREVFSQDSVSKNLFASMVGV